jgi:hypothetical protein
MQAKRIVPVLCALVFPFAVALVANGCGNKEDDAPATTAAPAPTPTPTPTPTPASSSGVIVTAGVADADAGDAATDGPKGTGGDATGIRACCAALNQNAASAPLDQKPMYLQAAAVCQGLVNNPQGRAALVQLRGILRGANMPSSCK